MADSTQVKELTSKLEQGIKDLFNSDAYADYLRTMSRFHKYSTRNTMLIHMQKPDATLVAGFNAWQTNFKRRVKKGEKAIKIFAPIPLKITKELEKIDPVTQRPIIGEDGEPLREEIEIKMARFRIVNVFDVSQTDGEPLPSLVQDLTGNVEQYEAFMDALRAVSPLPIVFEPLPDDTDGKCIFGDKIVIREGMSEVQTVSAIIHEIAHAKLHDLEAIRQTGENVEPKDRRTEEVEAESISFSVNSYFDIDTGANSFGYIAEWSRGRELKELNASLDTIRKATTELIDAIDGKFQELVKERNIVFSIDDMQITLEEPPITMPAELSPANQIYAKYANIVAERAAQYVVSSGTLLYTDDDAARAACDQIVSRVVNDMLLEPGEHEAGEHYPLYTQYMDNPDFKGRLEDFAFIKAYLEPKNAMRETPDIAKPQPKSAVNPAVAELLAGYARHAQVADPQRVGAGVLMTPVFDGGNFNRTGKKIRVTVEEPIGKYQIYSREINDNKQLFFLTASGRIDRTSEYFRDEYDEEAHKWVNVRPTEAEFDEVIPLIAAQFESDMADPTKWAKYQNAAVVNRLDDCEAHNVPVRELRNAEDAKRREDAALAGKEQERLFQEKFDNRVDEIAQAMASGKTISVGYDEYAFGGKNPMLDLFKLYDIKLPLRTQGWVNTGLAEVSESGYRYYSSKHKRNSTVIGGYLHELRNAIKLTPIEQKRNKPIPQQEVKNTVDKKLYEKFAELLPEFAKGDYSYLRLEAGGGMMPLSLEYIFGDRISVMHTYEMNGDLCYDPMMEFRFNNIGKTMEGVVFQQSIPPIYQYFDDNGRGMSVDGNGNNRAAHNLQYELNDFATMWLANIEQQGYMPVRGIMEIDGEDVKITFDAEGKPIMPEAEKQKVQVGDVLQIENKQWRVEEIDGDFSIKLKNIDPADNESNQMFMGHWEKRLEEAGYSIVSKSEQPTFRESEKSDVLDITAAPPEEKPAKEYDLGYGFLGNGITVWNRAEEINGDYPTVAHIGTDRSVTFYDKDMPHEIKQKIDTVANSPDTGAFGFTRAPENVPPHIENSPTPPIVHEAVKQVLSEKAEAENPKPDFLLPDPAISMVDMHKYGYEWAGVLPLKKERALELYDSNHAVFCLYTDDTEGIICDRNIINIHDGIFGIEEADWERSPLRAAQIAAIEQKEARLESELLHDTGNRFGIYQIPSGIDEAQHLRFTSIRELEANGLTVDRSNYELVYTAPFTERIEFLSDRYPVLNNIYSQFNTEHPADYTGRSVSVSDVIVLKYNGDTSAHFVDSAGFKELDNYVFFGEEPIKPLTIDTSTLSQVGTISNERAGATVAELEADVKAGKVISLAELAKAVHTEKPAANRSSASKTKPKLMERLEQGKQKAAQQGQPDTNKNKHREVE